MENHKNLPYSPEHTVTLQLDTEETVQEETNTSYYDLPLISYIGPPPDE